MLRTCFLVLATGVCATQAAPQSDSSLVRSRQHDPVSATEGLISRVIGDFFISRVQLEVIPADPATQHDVFELDSTADGRLVIRGNNGVSMSSGLGWWLKYWTNSSWSWGRQGSGNQINLSAKSTDIPLPSSTVRVVSPAEKRYAYNVCTFGYSTVFWSIEQWYEELDRFALWGINLPLAFVGQEYVIQQLYLRYNLTAEDLYPFFSGPAFLPWQRMGNMRGLGGPLTQDFMVAQRDMQKQIVARMRAFGMTPVLPGFSGHVPNALTKVYPSANFTYQSGWGNFNSTYSDVVLLEPTDPLFASLGADFHKLVLEEYGDEGEAPFFNADT